MSLLASKLYEERENRPQVPEDYAELVSQFLGRHIYDSAINQDKSLADAVDDALYALDESNSFGTLQRYYLEERYLHGRTKEELKAEFIAYIDLLLKDLESPAIRFLRHPKQSRPIQTIVKKYIRDPENI